MVRAMKMISKDKLKKEDEDKLLIETSIMIQLDHGNIVKLFEIFKDD
jgi:calcium-dependent protein kinase